jgi:hypothetical protein
MGQAAVYPYEERKKWLNKPPYAQTVYFPRAV